MSGHVQSPCDGCPAHNTQNLVHLGVEMEGSDFVVALAGNPNTGKSTVFNALTGLHQHTGNWPGKTVTRAEGGFLFDGSRFKIVDLPGTYSLLSTSTDEDVARDFILFGQPDVTVVVVDATRLERNLNLVLQVLEITGRTVICLNLVDEAKRHGIRVDERLLSKRLGVPVVPTVARLGAGIPELLQSINDVARGAYVCEPYRLKAGSSDLEAAITRVAEDVERLVPGLGNSRWVALRLLEGDERVIDAIRGGELATLVRERVASSPDTRNAVDSVDTDLVTARRSVE